MTISKKIYIFEKGQIVKLVKMGFGAEGCQNLTKDKQYTVVSGNGDQSKVFDDYILTPGVFEILDDDGEYITCQIDGNWGVFELVK